MHHLNHEPGIVLPGIKKKYILLILILLFTQYLFAQPTISSFTPASGPVGTTVTINGTNFSSSPASNNVFFGAVKAIVSAATSTSLTVSVPTGATYQPITVTVNNLTAYAASPFIVLFGGAITSNSFALKTEWTAAMYPSTISFGDLNDDGKPDLVVTNYNSNDISVFKNTGSNGTVSFAPAVSYAAGIKPEGLSIGDINGDGKPDIAVTSIDDHNISVFINTGSGGAISFAAKTDYYAGLNCWPRGIAIGDLDADGKPDLAVPDNNLFYDAGNPDPYGTLSIHKNTGPLGTAAFGQKITLITDDYPRNVAIGDLNGDGKPDLVATNTIAGSISIFTNNSTPGTIVFSTKRDYTTGTHTEQVSMGDLDGDGKPDLVVSNLTGGPGGSTISVFRNSSVGGVISFAPKQDLPGNSLLGVSLGDLDGDGKPDLAVADYSVNKVYVFKNNSTAGAISFAARMEYDAGSNPVGVCIGDADGDGIPDLCLSNSTGNKVSVLRIKNDPAISYFTPAGAVSGGSVTIKGTNFNGATTVSFGGAPVASFIVESPSSIKAVVGAGATGNATVTTAFGTRTLSGFTFFTVTATNNPVTFATEFAIYPSVVKDICTIRYKGQYMSKSYLIRLADVTGKLLSQKPVTQNLESLDLQNLSAGFYFIKIIDQKTGRFFTKTVVKI